MKFPLDAQGFKRLAFLVVVASALHGCANGHCRGVATPPPASTAGTAGPKPASTEELFLTVSVYKPDGSVQCSAKAGRSLDEMEKELADLRVTDRRKQSDGKIHASACNLATGMINVFVIPKTELERAIQRGFRALLAP